jgi:hypothetical protein
VVSCTLSPFYTRQNNWSFAGLTAGTGILENEYLFLLSEIEKELLVCPVCNLVTIDTD